jgi:parallel beta-helix repeat protein
MNEQIQPRNRAERRAAMRGKGRRAAGAALTAGSAALAMTAGVLGTGAPAGAATTITVTNLDDSGAGSLRDALANAADGDTINFQAGLTGTLTLTTGQLEVNDAVTVTGPGSGVVTIDGNAASSVFYLNAPGNADITISGLTITNGHAAHGGGIDNDDEHLTVADALVTANHSTDWGGGISADAPGNTLSLLRSQVTGNTAENGGGGVYLDDSVAVNVDASAVNGNHATGDGGGAMYFNTIDGDVTISNSQFDRNDGDGGGGAFYFSDIEGALTISSSSITGNTASNGGGGLYTGYVSGAIDISGTMIDGNHAGSSGGGLYLSESHGGVTVSSSSISGNTAENDGGGVYIGYFYQGFTIQSTTISGNTAASAGGGIWHAAGGQGSLVILDSTISGNTASDGWGGGLYENGSDSPTKIQNSTISGNTASAEGGAMWFGGYYGLELTQSTITGNTATAIGGIALYGSQQLAAASGGHRTQAQDEKSKPDKGKGTPKAQSKAEARKAEGPTVHAQSEGEVNATGNILDGNVGEDIGTNGNPSAVLTSNHSLLGVIGDGVVVSDAAGTITGADPLLGPLQNNGGPTETHALLTGSPAINTGPDPVPSFPTNEFDQRGDGFARVVDGVADICAFEVQAPPLPEPVVITPKFTG